LGRGPPSSGSLLLMQPLIDPINIKVAMIRRFMARSPWPFQNLP
jgi:hypothetical protein